MTHNLQTRSFFARMGQWVSIISIVCQTCSALGNWEVLEWSDCSSLPTLLPQIRSVSQTTPLIMGTRHSACLALSSGLQFPASYRNIQIQQSHLPEKKQKSFQPLVPAKPAQPPNIPCLFPQFPMTILAQLWWGSTFFPWTTGCHHSLAGGVLCVTHPRALEQNPSLMNKLKRKRSNCL